MKIFFFIFMLSVVGLSVADIQKNIPHRHPRHHRHHHRHPKHHQTLTAKGSVASEPSETSDPSSSAAPAGNSTITQDTARKSLKTQDDIPLEGPMNYNPAPSQVTAFNQSVYYQ